jgi:hypothetical protein
VAAACLLATQLVAGTPAVPPATALFKDDLKWVRGVNYVPSTAHNDMGIWLDYNATLVKEELGYAGASGFNAVRIFLHWLAWDHDAKAFMANVEDFCAAADAAGLKVLVVVLDSCFGDVNAEASWIADGRYRNMSWMPNPGPAIVDKGPTGWTQLDAYVSELVTAHKSDKRVLGWDVMNEPNFADKMIVPFIEHFTEIINRIDETHFTCVGGAENIPHVELANLTVLTYHDYNGGEDGAKLASGVAKAQSIGKSLGKPTMLTECFGRGSRSDDPAKRKWNDPAGDSLLSVLRGVNGCINSTEKTGFFIWELMFGVDQFNGGQPSTSHPGVLPYWGPPGAPYQGLILPEGAAGDRAGQWRFTEEGSLWKAHGVTRTCPPATPPAVDTADAAADAAAGLGVGVKWTECPGTTHIKPGDCNSPTHPCTKGSGATNVFKQPSLAACEAKCTAAKPVGNCAGVTWHDASAGAWATVCVLLSADAWADESQKMGHHDSACNSLAPCSCAIKPPGPPPPPPGPPPTDAAGCVIKQAALTYSQKVLKPPRHADRIHAALGLDACGGNVSLPQHAAASGVAVAGAAALTGAADFFVDAASGKDSNSGTTPATAFATLHAAQAAARGKKGAHATVHLLAGNPPTPHFLDKTLSLTPEDSHQTWLGEEATVVSGALSLTKTCAGKWTKVTTGTTAAGASAYSCELPAAVASFDSLFLNGLRQSKARFPNGDPLKIKDGYSTGCKTLAQWDISGIKQYPTNVMMVSKNGTKISQGSLLPGPGGAAAAAAAAAAGTVTTVTIEDRDIPRTSSTTGNNPSYYNTRFNETYNHPFWSTNSVSDDEQPPHRTATQPLA